jgi:chromosome segregation ATPase
MAIRMIFIWQSLLCLQANLRAAKDANKQVTYLRQQNTIENLESKLRALNAENESLYAEKIKLMESDGILRDQLRDAKSELDALRQKYRKEVDETRAQLQAHALNAQKELQELVEIRKSSELLATRLIIVDNQNLQLSKTIHQLERRLAFESELLAQEREQISKHLETIKIQKSVLLSAGSANMKYKNEIKALEARIKSLTTIEGVDDGVDLQEVLKQAQENERKAVYELRVLQGLQASLEYSNKVTIAENQEFKRVGFTPEKKEAFEKLERSLNAQREANARLETQVRAAMHRIRELEAKKS